MSELLVIAAIFAAPILFCAALLAISASMRSSQISQDEEQGHGVHP